MSGSRLFVYPDHVDSSTVTIDGHPGVILAAAPEAPYASVRLQQNPDFSA